jgi:hypothetical protein
LTIFKLSNYGWWKLKNADLSMYRRREALELRLPGFSNSQHMKVARLSALAPAACTP